jgi:hypothetical protein
MDTAFVCMVFTFFLYGLYHGGKEATTSAEARGIRAAERR